MIFRFLHPRIKHGMGTYSFNTGINFYCTIGDDVTENFYGICLCLLGFGFLYETYIRFKSDRPSVITKEEK